MEDDTEVGLSSTLNPVCPHCGSIPVGGPRAWTCPGCSANYRGLRGIIDLRTVEDAYLSNEADWAYATQLDDAFDRLDFLGILDLYFELSPEIPASLRDRQITHILTAPGRVGRWLEAIGRPDQTGPVLDLGCGSGSFLASIGRSGRPLAGVDIAMRWLIVARKRLDEEGLSQIPLVCGCSERLPFADRTFEGIIAGDVIEHVTDQRATLAEAHRVLEPGGRLFLASPNRFSLALEPHVQVWGVGFLPRRWMVDYVRWTSGRDFRAIRTLSSSEWKRLLADSPFAACRIEAPILPDSDLAHFGTLKRAVAVAYNRVVATRPGQAVARAIGPLFHVVCERTSEVESDQAARETSPATRPGSTTPGAPG
jgi:2-polyprenyl-3-methyl-5-hydroxy-6-metoxy-1,4-benzoquinol methylase